MLNENRTTFSKYLVLILFFGFIQYIGVGKSTWDIHYFCLGFALWMYLEDHRKLACRGAELL
jgi:hypothetical protein